MELFTYDVKSKNKLFLGRQYDHKSAVISFSGFKVDDPNDFIYFKLGEPVGKKYLLGDDLSVTITSEMTAKPAVMRGQLIEYRTTAEAEGEASYIKSSPVFYCQVAQSIRAEGTPDATDPTIDSAYTKIQAYEESARESAESAKESAEYASQVKYHVEAKVDKVTDAPEGHMAVFTSDGNIMDGGDPSGVKYYAGDNIQISANGIISATDTIYDDTDVRDLIADKVDKETGKGLSTNDYTAADKAKVDAIPTDPKYTDTTYAAGSNVIISNNVISAKDTTYTAGDNITIVGNAISAKDTTYTAGANIIINDDNVISATGGGGSETTYTAGKNIQITGTVISATDTVYDDTALSNRVDAVEALTDNLGDMSTDIDANTAARHTHDNMTILDGITADTIATWDAKADTSDIPTDAIDANTAARHTHDNMNAIASITLNNIVSWERAANDRHTHDNMTILDGITADTIAEITSNTAARHTHDNEVVLDSITAAKIATWDAKADASDIPTDDINANTAARHTHDNKTVLDNITATLFTEWNNKQNALTAGTDYLTPTAIAAAYAPLDTTFKVNTTSISDTQEALMGMITVNPNSCDDLPAGISGDHWLLTFKNLNNKGPQLLFKASLTSTVFYFRAIGTKGGTWMKVTGTAVT